MRAPLGRLGLLCLAAAAWGSDSGSVELVASVTATTQAALEAGLPVDLALVGSTWDDAPGCRLRVGVNISVRVAATLAVQPPSTARAVVTATPAVWPTAALITLTPTPQCVGSELDSPAAITAARTSTTGPPTVAGPAVQAIAALAVVVSAVGGSAASAAGLARAFGVAAAARCDGSEGGLSLPALSHPLRADVGSGAVRAALGAAVLNTALIASVAAVHGAAVGAVYLYRWRRRRPVSVGAAAAWLRFPGLVLPLYLLLLQPTAAAALVVVADGGSGDRFAALLLVVFHLAAAGLLCTALWRPAAAFSPRPPVADSVALRALTSVGWWRDLPALDTPAWRRGGSIVAALGPCLADATPAAPWFAAAEAVAALLLAAATAVGTASCTVAAWLQLALLLAAVAATVWLRSYQHHVGLACAVSSTVATAASAAAAVWYVGSPGDGPLWATRVLLAVVVGFAALRAVADGVRMVWWARGGPAVWLPLRDLRPPPGLQRELKAELRPPQLTRPLLVPRGPSSAPDTDEEELPVVARPPALNPPAPGHEPRVPAAPGPGATAADLLQYHAGLLASLEEEQRAVLRLEHSLAMRGQPRADDDTVSIGTDSDIASRTPPPEPRGFRVDPPRRQPQTAALAAAIATARAELRTLQEANATNAAPRPPFWPPSSGDDSDDAAMGRSSAVVGRRRRGLGPGPVEGQLRREQRRYSALCSAVDATEAPEATGRGRPDPLGASADSLETSSDETASVCDLRWADAEADAPEERRATAAEARDVLLQRHAVLQQRLAVLDEVRCSRDRLL